MRSASPLHEEVKPGLKGLAPADRAKVKPTPPRLVTDSLALDDAFAASEAAEPRWDYWLGVDQAGAHVVAVEVHPATPGEVGLMIRKKRWAETKAAEHLQKTRRVSRWVWIASRKTRIAKTTREYRQLAIQGIDLVGSTLVLGD